jgi:signal peptidase II
VLAGSGALSTSAQPGRRHIYAVIVITAIAVLALDHLTKWLVDTNLPLGGELWSRAPVSITHVVNRGAAFGVLPQFQWLYLVVAVVVVVYILLAGHRFGNTWYRQVLLGFVLGGAVSNGIDRLLQGYVVDFINIHFWPVFNVADSAIVVGIIVSILTSGLQPSAPRHASPT